MTSPRAQWERWRREGRPTIDSRKSLVDFLESNARWHVETALTADVRGLPIPAEAVDELAATVEDLVQLTRERGLCLGVA